MKGGPRVQFMRFLGLKHVKFQSGKTGWIERYALYYRDRNVIEVRSGFSAREKFLALQHELISFFIWLLPETLAGPLDKWLNRITIISQRIRPFAFPSAQRITYH